MNKFLEDCWEFNRLGDTPIDDSYENLYQAFKIIESEFEELKENLDKYKLASKIEGSRKEQLKAEILDDLGDIDVTVASFAYRMGLKRTIFECAQYTIATANLSKFPESLEEAVESVVNYEDDPRYENVDYKQIDDDRFVVYGNPKGTDHYKILKSVSWTDPQKKLNDLMKID